MPTKARRSDNAELVHGRRFEDGERKYIVQEYDWKGDFAYFQIWDYTDPENAEIIGRVSRAVSCARV